MKRWIGSSLRNWVKPETEAALISAWILFFPGKHSYFFYFLTALLLGITSIRRLLGNRNFRFDSYILVAIGINSGFLIASLFSPIPWKSLIFSIDILLISLYFSIQDFPEGSGQQFLLFILVSLSLTSLAVFGMAVLHLTDTPARIFFNNPILQGIASGMALLLSLFYSINRKSKIAMGAAAINLMGLVISASKAAFLGILFISVILLWHLARKWLFILAAIILGVVLIPNPLRSRISPQAFRNDPYIFDRLKIWQMSGRIILDHPWIGIGPDLYPEMALQYNFPQNKGFSRYGKIPESPHNDFLKILTETGLIGLAILAGFFFIFFRAIRACGIHQPFGFLLLFLVTEAFLINFLFNPFFLFLLLAILRFLPSPSPMYRSPSHLFRWLGSAMVLFVLGVFFLAPLVSHQLQKKALQTSVIEKKLLWLRQAQAWEPQEASLSANQGIILSEWFNLTNQLPAAVDALVALRQAQRLNPLAPQFYLEEAKLLRRFLEKNHAYKGLDREILTALNAALKIHPANPFILLQMAEVHRLFDRPSQAQEYARKSLLLEPNYIAAHYFLHHYFRFIPSPKEFDLFIGQIRRPVAKIEFSAGSYLSQLYRIPSGNGILREMK